MASQSSLGSRDKTPGDMADAKMKQSDSAAKNLIIKRGAPNYPQIGLNSGTMNLAKEEAGAVSKHGGANMQQQ